MMACWIALATEHEAPSNHFINGRVEPGRRDAESITNPGRPTPRATLHTGEAAREKVPSRELVSVET